MFVHVCSADRVYLANDDLSLRLDDYFDRKKKHFDGWVNEGNRLAPVRTLVLDLFGKPIGWEFVGKPMNSRSIRYDRGAWFPRRNKTSWVQSLLSALSASPFPRETLFEVVFPDPKNTRIVLEKVLVRGEDELRDPNVRAFRSSGSRWFVVVPEWLDEVPEHCAGPLVDAERIFDHFSSLDGLNVSILIEVDSKNCAIRSPLSSKLTSNSAPFKQS